jgi:spermidine synthase
VKASHIAVLLLIFTVFAYFLCSRRVRTSRPAVLFAIFCTGMAGMLFSLVLVFGFQVFCGYVFHQIGLLVTAMMVGVAAGSAQAVRQLDRLKSARSAFIKVEVFIIVFSCLLPVVFALLHPQFANPGVSVAVHTSFIILCFVSGRLVGAQFPLAMAIYSGPGTRLSSAAGLLYASDLFGGCVGGVLAGAVLLPILGLTMTCVVLAMVKTSSLVIFLASPREATTG